MDCGTGLLGTELLSVKISCSKSTEFSYKTQNDHRQVKNDQKKEKNKQKQTKRLTEDDHEMTKDSQTVQKRPQMKRRRKITTNNTMASLEMVLYPFQFESPM